MPFLNEPADVLLVEAAHVGEVEHAQAHEDEDLGPLGRVAAEGAEVLDDEQPRLRIEEEERARRRGGRASGRRSACAAMPPVATRLKPRRYSFVPSQAATT